MASQSSSANRSSSAYADEDARSTNSDWKHHDNTCSSLTNSTDSGVGEKKMSAQASAGHSHTGKRKAQKRPSDVAAEVIKGALETQQSKKIRLSSAGSSQGLKTETQPSAHALPVGSKKEPKKEIGVSLPTPVASVGSNKASTALLSYKYFVARYKPLREIDFIGINQNTINKSMWDQHKLLYGDSCCSTCPCESALPRLCENVMKDAKEKHAMKKHASEPLRATDVGFAKFFVRSYFPKLEAEFPNDSPSAVMQKLYQMWPKHQEQKRFGKICTALCPCIQGWKSIFLAKCLRPSNASKGKQTTNPPPSIQGIKDREQALALTKAEILRDSPPKAPSQQKEFAVTFDPSVALGFYCVTQMKGASSMCKIMSVSPSCPGNDARLVRGTVVVATATLMANIIVEAKADVRTHLELKHRYFAAREKKQKLRLWFINTHILASDLGQRRATAARSHWSSLGLWKGKLSDDGWAGGASNADKIGKSRKGSNESQTDASYHGVVPLSTYEASAKDSVEDRIPIAPLLGSSSLPRSRDRAGPKESILFKKSSNKPGNPPSKVSFSSELESIRLLGAEENSNSVAPSKEADDKIPGGHTALSYAIIHEDLQNVLALLQAGVDHEEEDANHKVPLDYARENMESLRHKLNHANISTAVMSMEERAQCISKLREFDLKKKLLKLYWEVEHMIRMSKAIDEWASIELQISGIRNLRLSEAGKQHPSSEHVFCKVVMDEIHDAEMPVIPLSSSPTWTDVDAPSYVCRYNEVESTYNKDKRVMVNIFKGTPTGTHVKLGSWSESVETLRKEATGEVECRLRTRTEFLLSASLSVNLRELVSEVSFKESKQKELSKHLRTVITWLESLQKESALVNVEIETNISLPICGDMSLLHAAIWLADRDSVERLLCQGADPTKKCAPGTALELATKLAETSNASKEVYDMVSKCSTGSQHHYGIAKNALVGEDNESKAEQKEADICDKTETLPSAKRSRPEASSLGARQNDTEKREGYEQCATPEDTSPPAPTEAAKSVKGDLPNLVNPDWMVVDARRCPSFSRAGGCEDGPKCRHGHVQAPVGKVCNFVPTEREFFKSYSSAMGVSVSSRDFHVHSEANANGDSFYTAAFKCPKENTVFYAEGGRQARRNNQGVYFYPDKEVALAAIRGVVTTVLLRRGLVVLQNTASLPKPPSTQTFVTDESRSQQGVSKNKDSQNTDRQKIEAEEGTAKTKSQEPIGQTPYDDLYDDIDQVPNDGSPDDLYDDIFPDTKSALRTENVATTREHSLHERFATESLPKLPKADWVIDNDRCPHFNRVGGCRLKGRCRYAHIHAPVGQVCSHKPTESEFFKSYSSAMGVTLSSRDFRQRKETNSNGVPFYTAAFICPKEKTVYLAEKGALARQSEQGLYFYPDEKSAISAVRGVVTTVLLRRGMLRLQSSADLQSSAKAPESPLIKGGAELPISAGKTGVPAARQPPPSNANQPSSEELFFVDTAGTPGPHDTGGQSSQRSELSSKPLHFESLEAKSDNPVYTNDAVVDPLTKCDLQPRRSRRAIQDDNTQNSSPQLSRAPDLSMAGNLPKFRNPDWMLKDVRRCHHFNIAGGCHFGAQCRNAHIHAPIGKLCTFLPGENEFYKLYGDAMGVSVSSSDFREKCAMTSGRVRCYTAAFVCPKENTIYLAEQGAHSRRSEQGLYYYPDQQSANAAVRGVATAVLLLRGMLCLDGTRAGGGESGSATSQGMDERLRGDRNIASLDVVLHKSDGNLESQNQTASLGASASTFSQGNLDDTQISQVTTNGVGVVVEPEVPKQVASGGLQLGGEAIAKSELKEFGASSRECVAQHDVALPALPSVDWMFENASRCIHFNRVGGCKFGSRCRNEHVQPPVGQISESDIGQEEFCYFYSNIVGVAVGKRDFYEKCEATSQGVWHTSAFRCPKERTIFYAQGGRQAQQSTQGLYWYRDKDTATAAVIGLVITVLQQRRGLTNVNKESYPQGTLNTSSMLPSEPRTDINAQESSVANNSGNQMPLRHERTSDSLIMTATPASNAPAPKQLAFSRQDPRASIYEQERQGAQYYGQASQASLAIPPNPSVATHIGVGGHQQDPRLSSSSSSSQVGVSAMQQDPRLLSSAASSQIATGATQQDPRLRSSAASDAASQVGTNAIHHVAGFQTSAAKCQAGTSAVQHDPRLVSASTPGQQKPENFVAQESGSNGQWQSVGGINDSILPGTSNCEDTLPTLESVDWMLDNAQRRCPHFSRSDGCRFGSSCRNAHVHGPLGHVNDHLDRVDQFYRLYEKIFGIRISSRDINEFSAPNAVGTLFYTAAFVCPSENTIYYAENCTEGRQSHQGLYWYLTQESANAAVKRVVLTALERRGLMAALDDPPLPEPLSVETPSYHPHNEESPHQSYEGFPGSNLQNDDVVWRSSDIIELLGNENGLFHSLYLKIFPGHQLRKSCWEVYKEVIGGYELATASFKSPAEIHATYFPRDFGGILYDKLYWYDNEKKAKGVAFFAFLVEMADRGKISDAKRFVYEAKFKDMATSAPQNDRKRNGPHVNLAESGGAFCSSEQEHFTQRTKRGRNGGRGKKKSKRKTEKHQVRQTEQNLEKQKPSTEQRKVDRQQSLMATGLAQLQKLAQQTKR